MVETTTDPARDLAPLLGSARRGEQAAFAELYRRFARAVHGIVTARAGHRDAEDVTQEVFATAFRALEGVRDAASFPGWLCAIARNAATDHVRARKRRPEPAPLEGVEASASRAVRSDAGRSDQELRERVLACLAELPEAYRETLVLRLVEGLTGPEIAERTGLAPASVRVNLCRGMSLLRPLLEREGWP